MTEWDIARSQRQCERCHAVFQELQEYYSAIYEVAGFFQRRDFCLECWQGGVDEMFSFWKTQVPAREEKPKKFVDDDVIVDFFQRLEGAEDQLKINFRYILTLVLMRKKLLRFEGSRREGKVEYLKVKLRGEDRVQEVLNPGITPDMMEQLTVEVGNILNVQL